MSKDARRYTTAQYQRLESTVRGHFEKEWKLKWNVSEFLADTHIIRLLWSMLSVTN